MKKIMAWVAVGLVAIIGITVGVGLTSGPAYKYSWCSATMSTVFVPNVHGALQPKLDQLAVEEHDGAPTGPILAAENQAVATVNDLNQDNYAIANGDASQELQATAQGMEADEQAITEDVVIRSLATKLASDCGANENANDALVPAVPSSSS
jgi:hypothetical protein